MSNDIPETKAEAGTGKIPSEATCYLLPCPFCGDKIPDIVQTDRDIYVGCSNCDAHGEWFNDVGEDSKGYAIGSWNRRDPVNSIIAKAKSMVGSQTDDDLQKFVDWMTGFVGR